MNTTKQITEIALTDCFNNCGRVLYRPTQELEEALRTNNKDFLTCRRCKEKGK